MDIDLNEIDMYRGTHSEGKLRLTGLDLACAVLLVVVVGTLIWGNHMVTAAEIIK